MVSVGSPSSMHRIQRAAVLKMAKTVSIGGTTTSTGRSNRELKA
jgi:hypothetical protein